MKTRLIGVVTPASAVSQPVIDGMNVSRTTPTITANHRTLYFSRSRCVRSSQNSATSNAAATTSANG